MLNINSCSRSILISAVTVLMLSACGGSDNASSTSSSSSSASQPVIFATNFSGANRTTTLESGSFGSYSGSDPQGGSGSEFYTANSTDDVYVFFHSIPNTAVQNAGTINYLYSGIYVMAPGLTTPLSGNVAGLSVAGKSKFTFTFNQNPEWFNSTDNKFGVLLTMSESYNDCRIKLWQVVTPTSKDATTYSINLSNFQVLVDPTHNVPDCGANLSASEVLAQQSVAQIDFKANGGAAKFITEGAVHEGANFTNLDSYNGYATTLVVTGPLKFE